MLIYLSLASVWPRSVDNYSSLALSHKLIMKDKQSSACQLPTRIRSHMKSLPLSTQLQAGRVWCPVRGRPIWSWLAVFPLTSVCLRLFYFPLMKRRREGTKGRRGGWGGGWGVGGGWRYLFMAEALPVLATHSTAGVPISYSLSCAVVCVTEEDAGWGLTGCRGTERRLRHPSSRPKRKQSAVNKL